MTPREAFFLESPTRYVDYRLNTVQQVEQDGSASAAWLTFRETLYLTIAKYSYGQSLELVHSSLKKALKALNTFAASGGNPMDLSEKEVYVTCLSGLSLALLFGEKTPTFAWLGKGQDGLYDRLLNLGGAGIEASRNLLHPTAHQHLYDALTAGVKKENAVPHIELFLRNFYESLYECHWYNAHIKHHPSFFGYWSFELAVAVKAFNLEDTTFQDNIFYPRDLVKARLLKTWEDSDLGEIDRKASDLLKAQKKLEGTRDLLSQFFAGAIQGEDAPEGVEEAVESIDLLSGMLGMDPDSLEENPDLMRNLFLQALSGMVGLSGQVVNLTDPNASLDPETNEMLKAFKDLEKQFSKDGALDVGDLLKDMPEEVRKELETTSTEDVQQHLNRQFGDLNTALEQMIADKSIKLEQLLAGLEKMMEEYSGLLGSGDSEYNVEAEVRKELGAKLAEDRKRDGMDNFDWSSLWKE